MNSRLGQTYLGFPLLVALVLWGAVGLWLGLSPTPTRSVAPPPPPAPASRIVLPLPVASAAVADPAWPFPGGPELRQRPDGFWEVVPSRATIGAGAPAEEVPPVAIALAGYAQFPWELTGVVTAATGDFAAIRQPHGETRRLRVSDALEDATVVAVVPGVGIVGAGRVELRWPSGEAATLVEGAAPPPWPTRPHYTITWRPTGETWPWAGDHPVALPEGATLQRDPATGAFRWAAAGGPWQPLSLSRAVPAP